VVLLPALVRSWWGQRRLWGVAAAVAIVLVLPFFLWDPRAFWDIVAAKHFARPVIPHALTLLALAQQSLGLDLPPTTGWLFALVLIALVAWKTPQRAGAALGPYLAASLLAFILGHKQGYFNYYVLATYLLLWGLVAADDDTEDEEADIQERIHTKEGNP